jgi:molybdate transport system substrate-binding protein
VTPPEPATLTVYAAASLSEAFTELGRKLEAEHPGLTVRFSFAGSQQLAAQIEQGAPADAFASADPRWMDFLASWPRRVCWRGRARCSPGTAWC